jgi:uncharacterized membrane protein YhaH (DUF805 family)
MQMYLKLVVIGAKMFEAKYSRFKFWIISICLLIPTTILNTMAKALEKGGKDDISLFFYLIVFILSLIWINTLANRIRDFGSDPWYALWSLIPLVNLGMTFYYGILKHKSKSSNAIFDKPTLTKAVINHTKDTVCNIKPKVNEYIEKYSQYNCNNNDMNFEINEDNIYEQVMVEIEENKKVKSAWAKALAQSQGDENKAKALYISMRVQEIQREQEEYNFYLEEQRKQEKLKLLGGKELSQQEQQFLKKYNVYIFSDNVEINQDYIKVYLSDGTKIYQRG